MWLGIVLGRVICEEFCGLVRVTDVVLTHPHVDEYVDKDELKDIAGFVFGPCASDIYLPRVEHEKDNSRGPCDVWQQRTVDGCRWEMVFRLLVVDIIDNGGSDHLEHLAQVHRKRRHAVHHIVEVDVNQLAGDALDVEIPHVFLDRKHGRFDGLGAHACHDPPLAVCREHALGIAEAVADGAEFRPKDCRDVALGKLDHVHIVNVELCSGKDVHAPERLFALLQQLAGLLVVKHARTVVHNERIVRVALDDDGLFATTPSTTTPSVDFFLFGHCEGGFVGNYIDDELVHFFFFYKEK